MCQPMVAIHTIKTNYTRKKRSYNHKKNSSNNSQKGMTTA